MLTADQVRKSLKILWAPETGKLYKDESIKTVQERHIVILAEGLGALDATGLEALMREVGPRTYFETERDVLNLHSSVRDFVSLLEGAMTFDQYLRDHPRGRNGFRFR